MQSAHKEKIDIIRQRFGWDHFNSTYLDNWIHFYLENKFYDVDETIAKIERRITMECNELFSYEITAAMKKLMSCGTAVDIGEDVNGSVVLYTMTKRDFPTSANRPDRLKNFDIMINYVTRLRPQSSNSGTFTLLVNQAGASLWSNTDMSFITTVALRMSKYWPGALTRVILVKMSRGITTLLKPIISSLPSHLQERVILLSERELNDGKLLEYFPKHVIPVELGGTNANVDHPDLFVDLMQRATAYYAEKKDIWRNWSPKYPNEHHTLYYYESFLEAEASNKKLDSYSRRSSVHPDDFYECKTAEIDEESVICDTPHGQRGVFEQGRFLHTYEAHCRKIFMDCYMEGMDKLKDLYICSQEQCTSDLDVDNPHLTDINIQRFSIVTAILLRLLFWPFFFVTASQFSMAVLFFLLFMVSLMVTTYLALFHNILETLSSMLILVLLSYQGALILSRWLQCVWFAFHGRPIITLHLKGKPLGGIIQTILWASVFILTIIAFVVVIAQEKNIERATRAGFGLGWIACAIILGLLHFFSLFPFVLSRREAPQSSDLQFLSVYLMLDVTEDVEEPKQTSSQDLNVASLYVVGLGTVAIALGISHMITAKVELLVFSTIFTWLCTLVLNSLLSYLPSMKFDLSKKLFQASTLMFAMVWTYLVSEIGLIDTSHTPGTTIAVICSLSFGLVALVVLGKFIKAQRARRIFLKIGYVYLILLVLLGVGCSYAVSWRLGIAVTCILIHSAFCIRRSNIAGALGLTIILIGAFVLGVAILSYATYIVAPRHESDHVMTSLITKNTDLFFCQQTFSGTLTQTHFAIFSYLALASSAALSRTELGTWLPDFTQQEWVDLGKGVTITLFANRQRTVYIFSVGGCSNKSYCVQFMSYWIESISLAALELTLPQGWVVPIVDAAAFLYDNLEFPKIDVQVQDFAEQSLQSIPSSAAIYFTGYGFGGWIARLVGVRLNLFSITFNAPEIWRSIEKYDLDQESVARLNTNIVLDHSWAFDSLASRGLETGCKKTQDCSSINAVLCFLLSSCANSDSLHSCSNLE